MKDIYKTLSLIAGITWITLSLIYHNSFNYIKSNYKCEYSLQKRLSQIKIYNESSDFLINTTGCYIRNYAKQFKFKEAVNFHQSCPRRSVFIKRISEDSIMFIIDWEKMKKYNENIHNVTCCYQYASRSTVLMKEDSQITYSSCTPFSNGTIVKLKKEFIKVTCGKDPIKSVKVIYEDAYIILKKILYNTTKQSEQHWNVLIIGMDTMSRGRVRSSMPKTAKYLKDHNWLDYKGYQKVGFNTFPNVMSILTGKRMSTIYTKCKPTMDNCRESLMWTKFKEAGYVTAYGEDFLRLPDTFSSYGFRVSPTDHYMRPFFLTGEKEIGNIVCAHSQVSASVILDYATEFANAYNNDRFFGLFWINSYSHNKFNSPLLFDDKMVEFLEKLEHSGVLNNTFIMFLSDHGIRYGKMRFTVESYYEERLPMLYMWVPLKFRKQYEDEYYAMQLNHGRLTSHLDLHMTLWDILKMSNKSISVIKSEACLTCKSLFQEVSTTRNCTDAGVSEKWCTCHELLTVSLDEEGTRRSLELAVRNIQNITDGVKTVQCTKCSDLKLKTVLRTHFYHAKNRTYYVIAFLMSPGDVGYETKVMNVGDTYTIMESTETITEYNTRGNCVINKKDRSYCVCEKLNKCKVDGRNNNTL